MIENTVKSVRRKQVVDDAYFEKLCQEMISLYHLDQVGSSDAAKMDLGPLPVTAKVLIGSLLTVWCVLIIHSVALFLKKRATEVKMTRKQ